MTQPLYLGAARTVITPKVGGRLYGYVPDLYSTGIEDDLTVTALYFFQDNVRCLMLSCTVASVQTALTNRIFREIEETFSVPAANCILSSTHTHCAPNLTGTYGWGDIDTGYCEEIFIPGIMKSVGEAIENAVPVTAGYAVQNSTAGINRRQLNPDNTVSLGQNPWGCHDPKMTVLSFKEADGNTIASLIHYGCHGTAAGSIPHVTRDWSGVMTDTLDKVTGGITAYFNGPEGDIGPRLSNGRTTSGSKDVCTGMRYVYEIGSVAGGDAVTAWKQIPEYRPVCLSCFNGVLRVPLAPRESPDIAKSQYERFRQYTVNIGGKAADHYRQLLASYENGYEEQDFLEIPQTLIRIGDIVFASFPYELFCEIGLRIDQASPFPHVLSLSNANGSEGYFPTADQLFRGGYEMEMYQWANIQPYGPDADWHLVKETLKNLENIHS